ncbi:MAG: type VI secretion system accessory protein TagJ [Pseudomonadota bacterium]
MSSLTMSIPAPRTPAEQALRDADPQRALQLLQEQVRAKPADARLRIFLFQLLAVLGQWDRALTQLGVVAELDASALPMVQTYRETIQCERLRAQVFAGRKVPMLMGEPEPWLALLVEALLRDGRGEAEAAAQLRAQALDQAPATPGEADGQAFEWFADADTRLGPVVEAVINGRYCWVPVNRLAELRFEPPTDLRDRVWTAAQFLFSNGGETVAFVPTRYAGTALDVGPLALAQRTDWAEPQPGTCIGSGQRCFATDVADLPLMDLRSVQLRPVHE